LHTIRTHKRLLVLGEPGMGKTVATHRMMWETARATDPVIPVYVPLIFFQDSLMASVRVALNETDVLRLDEKTLPLFLNEANKCLIMFDGLNEIPGQQRDRAITAIADFMREFSRHQYVVTSRSQDIAWKKLHRIDRIKNAVVIERITDQHVQNYLIAHLGDQGRKLYAQFNERMRGLAHTPLLLSLIKDAGLTEEKLPSNQGELFDNFVDQMLRRDERLDPIVPPEIEKRALAHLAFTLQQDHKLTCTRERAIKTLSKIDSEYSAETIFQAVLGHGLLFGEKQIRFLHQSVQEYFVALALCKVVQDELEASIWQRRVKRVLRCNLLVNLARESWWAESFFQLAGLTDNPSWLIQEIASVNPWLAFWCDLEGKPIDKEVHAEVEKMSVGLLQSHSIKQRRRAVRELSRFENPRTIAYLVEALEDKDNTISTVAIQAIVRLGDAAIDPLMAMLDDGEEHIRRNAYRALGEIWHLVDQDTNIRRSAVREIDDNRAIEHLIMALKDNDEYVRSGAARALGDLGDERVVEPLVAVLRDDSEIVRSAAVISLGALGDARAVTSLTETLEIDGWVNGWVRLEAVRALQNIGTPEALTAIREYNI
jgi:HEAT repeat protein